MGAKNSFTNKRGIRGLNAVSTPVTSRLFVELVVLEVYKDINKTCAVWCCVGAFPLGRTVLALFLRGVLQRFPLGNLLVTG